MSRPGAARESVCLSTALPAGRATNFWIFFRFVKWWLHLGTLLICISHKWGTVPFHVVREYLYFFFCDFFVYVFSLFLKLWAFLDFFSDFRTLPYVRDRSFWGPSMLVSVLIFCSFFIVCMCQQCVYPFSNRWRFGSVQFWLLWIMLYMNILLYCAWMTVSSFLWDKHPAVELLGLWSTYA